MRYGRPGWFAVVVVVLLVVILLVDNGNLHLG